MVVDDAVNSRQPEPGPFAALFRREEWLEDVRLDLAAHPNAGVAHTNARVIFRRHPGEHFSEVGAGRDGSMERERAAIRHGGAGVYAKIGQPLVDLAFVCSD